ncbi:UNVERIFIED_CONTAM: hypothetical protein GTU68_030781, partial [Idotea baltica]|nr:hypothetical protein [Idotea baltica]
MNFLLSLHIYICILKHLNAENLLKVGCYDEKDVSGFVPLESFFEEKSATACVTACQNLHKRFAGIQKGDSCLCGEYYSGTDSDSCNIPCPSNRNETCGGESTVSVYETKGGALGSPTSLALIKRSENNLHISWQPPATGLSELKQYKVVAKPIFYFTEQTHPADKTYIYSPLTQTAFLDGLHPGVKYRIEVRALSEKGESYMSTLDAWTRVGKPDEPIIPEIISHTTESMLVELREVIPSGGPITSYHIVVVDETLPVVIDYSLLYDYHTASNQGLPYYVTAELTKETFDTMFTVGDGKYYGKYFNSPLESNKDYHILLGVISTINETKSSYSPSSHSQHKTEISHFDFAHHEKTGSEEDIAYPANQNNALILGLSIAIGLFAFLLFASVLMYLALRVYFKKNSRHSGDHQELAVHAHIPHQDYENGYAVGAHYLDTEDSSPDHYRLLREKVTIIPHQNINIVGDIGIGKFGDVKKGVSLNNGSAQMNSLIHRIQDDSLSLIQKSEMLKEFDKHIRIGKHANVVSLHGLLEELNIISIVFEYETLTLKSNLIESRAVQHYPVYAEKNRRFSTLQESQLLEILAGVARGMSFLHSLNIAHDQLSARNIALRDGLHPKITGFGLLHFHNDVYIPDYRRWQAPEVLRSKVSSCRSDLWSFGCLMWEVVTLG